MRGYKQSEPAEIVWQEILTLYQPIWNQTEEFPKMLTDCSNVWYTGESKSKTNK